MRIIDADALRESIITRQTEMSYEDAWALTCVDNAPTIEPQKWVSCDERLPEEKKEVLVSADGDLYIAILETINGKSFWSEVIEYRYIMGVDAWMPLPEPWKGEEE